MRKDAQKGRNSRQCECWEMTQCLVRIRRSKAKKDRSAGSMVSPAPDWQSLSLLQEWFLLKSHTRLVKVCDPVCTQHFTSYHQEREKGRNSSNSRPYAKHLGRTPEIMLIQIQLWSWLQFKVFQWRFFFTIDIGKYHVSQIYNETGINNRSSEP